MKYDVYEVRTTKGEALTLEYVPTEPFYDALKVMESLKTNFDEVVTISNVGYADHIGGTPYKEK